MWKLVHKNIYSKAQSMINLYKIVPPELFVQAHDQHHALMYYKKWKTLLNSYSLWQINNTDMLEYELD